MRKPLLTAFALVLALASCTKLVLDPLRIQVAEGHIPCEVLREGEDQTDGRE